MSSSDPKNLRETRGPQSGKFDPVDVVEATVVLDTGGELSTQPGLEDCLLCIYGGPIGRRFVLGDTISAIGRDLDCEITISHGTVSRRHAELRGRRNARTVEDLGSTNGIYVNGAPVKKADLSSGDFIKIGEVIFKYLSGDNIEAAYHEEIYRLTIEDGLTAISNKRFLDEFLDREFARSRRYSRPLALMMIDIDHFKQVNDVHGHLAGNAILSELANVLRPRIRRDECFARYGGEEFCVVMPESMAAGAARYAEIIRIMVETNSFLFEGKRIPITVSIGVADKTRNMDSPSELIAAADQCLYKAKERGRNQVVFVKG
jgi:two-component system, cell cycle response regulator